MNINVIFVFFFTFIPSIRTFQYHKRWIPSNSWSQPSNWQPPRLPCPHDNVLLSSDVIIIEDNITMATGLVFNSDSEMVLGSNTNIVFAGGVGPNVGNRRKRNEPAKQCAGNLLSYFPSGLARSVH